MPGDLVTYVMLKSAFGPNSTVKSGLWSTNSHSPHSGEDVMCVTTSTYKSGFELTTSTLKSAKLLTTCTLPCRGIPLKVQLSLSIGSDCKAAESVLAGAGSTGSGWPIQANSERNMNRKAFMICWN